MPPPDARPRVSVVVPTCGRPALLRRCLAALLAQRLMRGEFEVLVVDDGCDEVTRQTVARAGSSAAVRVRYLLAGPRGGPAAARNVGWREAAADVIAFTDDDCIPSRGWLQAGLDAIDTGIEGACGQVIVPIPARPSDYQRDAAGLERAEFVTANCFYRRRALEMVGGFDPRFKLAWREDSDVFFGLLERGLPLAYAPGALVVHPVRGAGWGVSLGQQRKNLFNALLYRKHPTLYRQRIQARPPVGYYAILLAALTAVAAAVFDLPTAAWLAASTWVVLTGRFAAQRLHHTSRAPAHVAEMLVTSILIPALAVFWRLVGAARFKVPFL